VLGRQGRSSGVWPPTDTVSSEASRPESFLILLSVSARRTIPFADPNPLIRWPPPTMDKEINVLALVKGEEKFIFLFDDNNRDQTLRQLARFAADPELDFSWYDAAMLSRKIREAVPVEDDLLIDSEMDNLSLEDFG
jgi:hypothetical protein